MTDTERLELLTHLCRSPSHGLTIKRNGDVIDINFIANTGGQGYAGYGTTVADAIDRLYARIAMHVAKKLTS